MIKRAVKAISLLVVVSMLLNSINAVFPTAAFAYSPLEQTLKDETNNLIAFTPVRPDTATSTTYSTPSQTVPLPKDVEGNWAQSQIADWLQKGLVSGYPDGSFQPNKLISRIEFVVLVNRLYEIQLNKVPINFTDVSSSAWYVHEAAKAAIYMKGYEDNTFRPENLISRGEAAVILARILKLPNGGSITATMGFTDLDNTVSWNKDAISTVIAFGLMNGYPDKTFRAAKALTRAEAVVLLDPLYKFLYPQLNDGSLSIKPVNSVIYKPGSFGPESGQFIHSGDLIINVPDVILKNTLITGDLLFGEGIGEGNVTLDHVVVNGITTIKGGGKDSIHLVDSTFSNVNIAKVNGQVAVVAEGSTTLKDVSISSSTALQMSSGNESSIGTVTVSTYRKVTLSGNFPNIVLTSPTDLTFIKGTVVKLTLTELAAGANIKLNEDSNLDTLYAGSAANITGLGKIDTVLMISEGVTMTQTPRIIVPASDIPTVTPTPTMPPELLLPLLLTPAPKATPVPTPVGNGV